MKIKIYLKDPDTLWESINDAVDELKLPDLSDSELEVVKEQRKNLYKGISEKWFEYGEYVMLEMDTEEKTCIVLPVDNQN